MRDARVEVAVFTVRAGRVEVLLVRRPGNRWSVPGGPMPAGAGLEGAALAALGDQTGVRDISAEQLATFDRPPDGLAVAYLALIAAERHQLAPGPDAVEVRWLPADDLPPMGPEAERVVRAGLARLRAKTAYAPVAFQLLPDAFTMSDLRAVYESILSTPLDPRNFRRDVLAAGVVEPLGRTRSEGRGRPARLYRSAGGDFAVVPRERRAARAITRQPTEPA
jgi:8-oxo-dGTP diphosphatase